MLSQHSRFKLPGIDKNRTKIVWIFARVLSKALESAFTRKVTLETSIDAIHNKNSPATSRHSKALQSATDNENSMAMPPCVHKIKRGVVFCDDQSSLVTLLPRQADEPIVEKLQIGLGHGADYHHAITCHCL
jgi:hypothetical protein